MLQITSNNSFK